MAEFTIINHREKMAKDFDKVLVSLLNTIIFMNFLRFSYMYDNLKYIILFNT